MGDEEMVMLGLITAALTPGEAYRATFHRNTVKHQRIPVMQPVFQPGGERFAIMRAHESMAAAERAKWAAHQQALRRARPIIAQWSEWERQTRMEAWR